MVLSIDFGVFHLTTRAKDPTLALSTLARVVGTRVPLLSVNNWNVCKLFPSVATWRGQITRRSLCTSSDHRLPFFLSASAISRASLVHLLNLPLYE